ncbi:MAG: hypothetical protein D6732_28070 [Methanobacteriota archaeon]|nr:MAG: hypothetical protein D6732_28070 [Euryarchaeota archaeon]
MEFLKQVKYFLLGFGGAGVILLLFFLTNDKGKTAISLGGSTISARLNESTLTPVRIFLISIEFIWLFSWAIFYIRLSRNASQPAPEETAKKIEAFEPKYFQGVAAFLFLLLILSFGIPYLFGPGIAQFHNHSTDDPFDQRINVKAHTFVFEFDLNNNGTYISSLSKDSPAVQLKTNVRYLFVLVSTDTTHGFGLYSPDGVLLGQNQIIPGYENYYYFTFEEAGTYKILCMEYCGAGHQVMMSYISVV